MADTNGAERIHMPNPLMPPELAAQIEQTRRFWAGYTMTAPSPEPPAQPAAADAGDDDEFKSEHSKKSVLRDLAEERTKRQELQAEVDALKPLREQFDALAKVFAPAVPQDGDTVTATLTEVQNRLDLADRQAAVERTARKYGLTEDADVAILSAIPDATAMEAAAKRLQEAAVNKPGNRQLPKPDRTVGAGGDEKSSGSVAAGRDLYRSMRNKN